MAEGVGQSAIDILKDEQNQLGIATNRQTDLVAPEKITKVKATPGENGEWSSEEIEEDSPAKDESVVDNLESDAENKAKVLQDFCKTVDGRILEFDARINAFKDQIVTLSTEAINRNCWPGIAFSTANPGITSDFSNPTTYLYDAEQIKIYSNMAGPSVNYSATNPFDPDSTTALTSSLSGYGYENASNNDGGSSAGTARFDISTTIGDHANQVIDATYTYRGAGAAPEATNTDLTGSDAQDRCVEIQSEIANLQTQITNIRNERDALRADLNTIKSNKSEKELQVWGLKNHKREVESRKTRNNNVIAAIENLS